MTFGRSFKFIQGRLGKRLFPISLILFLISIYEVLFAFSLIPYFSFLIFGELPVLPIFDKLAWVSDQGIHVMFWFLVLLRFCVQSLQAFIVSHVVYNVMSLGIHKSFQHFIFSLTDGNDEARIIVKDNEFLSMYVAFPFVNIISECGVLAFATVAMLIFYPAAIALVTLFVMCILPLMFYNRLLQRKYSALRVEYDIKVFKEIASLITNKRFISTLLLNAKANSLIINLTEKLKSAYSKQYTVQILSKNLIEVFVLIFLATVIVASSTLDQSVLFIIFTIFLRMAQSATRLQMHVQTLQFGSESLQNYTNKVNENAGGPQEITFKVEENKAQWRIENIRNGKSVYLNKNKIYRLVGPSGSGKSTILNSLDSSLYHQKFTKYRFAPQFTTLRAGTLSELDQFYKVSQKDTNLDLFLLSELKIKDVGINRDLDVITKTISGGEAQKLISRVLYDNGTKLLIADELFSNLPLDQEEKLLLLLKKNFDTIIYTSHKSTISDASELTIDELI